MTRISTFDDWIDWFKEWQKDIGDDADLPGDYKFESEPRLRIPDVKFNRSIGDHAGMRYSVDGDLLSETEYEKHLSEALPDAEDERVLNEIFKDKDWGSSDELVGRDLSPCEQGEPSESILPRLSECRLQESGLRGTDEGAAGAGGGQGSG